MLADEVSTGAFIFKFKSAYKFQVFLLVFLYFYLTIWRTNFYRGTKFIITEAWLFCLKKKYFTSILVHNYHVTAMTDDGKLTLLYQVIYCFGFKNLNSVMGL